jgi:hypothetical protein
MIWPFLSYRDLNNIEAVKSRYLKRLLCVSKYSKSRLVYELIGEKYFVEELKKKKIELETTNANQKCIEIKNNKNDDIPLSFYSTLLRLSNQIYGSHLTVLTKICLLDMPFMDFTI